MLITKRNMMSGKKLPYARRLAYLGSTGMQYMRLPYIWGREYNRIKVKFAYRTDNIGGQSVFGSQTNTIFGIILYNNSLYVGNSGRFGTILLDVKKGTVFDVDIECSNRIVRANVNGVVSSFEYTTPFDDNKCLLFANTNSNGSVPPAQQAMINMYECEYRFDNNRGRLIPVMSYEGKPEMYDIVSETFAERHGDFLYGELDGGGV